jgi:putative addiction module component (TIGR02574 family)
MKAELEKELAALSLEEKNEVFTFLMPFVTPGFDDEVPADLMAELERRLAAHEADPTGSITLEEFKKRRFAGT